MLDIHDRESRTHKILVALTFSWMDIFYITMQLTKINMHVIYICVYSGSGLKVSNNLSQCLQFLQAIASCQRQCISVSNNAAFYWGEISKGVVLMQWMEETVNITKVLLKPLDHFHCIDSPGSPHFNLKKLWPSSAIFHCETHHQIPIPANQLPNCL